jgi:hypothetical protein
MKSCADRGSRHRGPRTQRKSRERRFWARRYATPAIWLWADHGGLVRYHLIHAGHQHFAVPKSLRPAARLDHSGHWRRNSSPTLSKLPVSSASDSCGIVRRCVGRSRANRSRRPSASGAATACSAARRYRRFTLLEPEVLPGASLRGAVHDVPVWPHEVDVT